MNYAAAQPPKTAFAQSRFNKSKRDNLVMWSFARRFIFVCFPNRKAIKRLWQKFEGQTK